MLFSGTSMCTLLKGKGCGPVARDIIVLDEVLVRNLDGKVVLMGIGMVRGWATHNALNLPQGFLVMRF